MEPKVRYKPSASIRRAGQGQVNVKLRNASFGDNAHRRHSSFYRQTFFALFVCGTVAFSVMNIIILKHASMLRMNVSFLEGRADTIPSPHHIFSRKAEVRRKSSSEKILEKSRNDTENSKTRNEVISKNKILTIESNKTSIDIRAADIKTEVSKPSQTNPSPKNRIDVLSLAGKTMKQRNIQIQQHEMSHERSSGRRSEPGIRPKNRESGLIHQNVWFDDRILYDNLTLPKDFVLEIPLVDPLSKRFNTSSLNPIQTNREVRYLGVLLDAGRHYFNIHWIERMLDVLAALNYNLLHFRLTDDQAFNVQLDSQPLLAYPAVLHNNTRVYTPTELRRIVRYAQAKGIHVIPEINVPGHAGAWGGVPDLIVQCPKFICEMGYGIPMNVSSPNVYHVLKDVLTEIVDIFDNPLFLHLGGDEVEMVKSCLEEVGEDPFIYKHFEAMLAGIVAELGYNDTQIIRWETTGTIDYDYSRTGRITHFWYAHPGRTAQWSKYGSDFDNPVFLSSGLYFDTNVEDSAWEVYVKTKRLKHMLHKKSPILGVIAGTFELDAKYWLDRNVVGRLVAVSLGASGLNTTSSSDFYRMYRDTCRTVGFSNDVCALYGRPPVRYKHFRSELKDGQEPHVTWRQWRSDICQRYTSQRHARGYKTRPVDQNNNSKRFVEAAKERFWNSIYKDETWPGTRNFVEYLPGTNRTNVFYPFQSGRLVPNTGIILDLSKYPVSHGRLSKLITEMITPLGLRMVQLRLVDDISFAFFSLYTPQFFYAKPHTENVKYPSTADLRKISQEAAKDGVTIMPEISISTNAGGWYHSNYNVECGEFLCEHGRYIPQKIEDPNYLPIAFSLIKELLQFTSGSYIHLGYDERIKSTPCFQEAGRKHKLPKFDEFEKSLGRLLKFIGVTDEKVVRWRNHEQVQYPGRIGHITQYSAEAPFDEDITPTTAPWIGTVDVRKGGPWQVYSTTREMAAKSPAAIVAQFGEMGVFEMERNNIEHRLVAFNLGTLDRPKMSRSEFLQEYPTICSSYFEFQAGISNIPSIVSRAKTLCKVVAASNKDAPSFSEFDGDLFWKHVANATCQERTQPSYKVLFKEANEIPTWFTINAA